MLPYFVEITVIHENSVDPDQTPRSAASDMGLPCLLMSFLWTLGINGLKTQPCSICCCCHSFF